MSPGGQFDEGALRFEFDDSWHVVKYDDAPAYRNGIENLDRTRGVDLVARRLRGKGLFFVEVKDFRGHRIENKARVSGGDLAYEVACKVRDTLAGLIAAQRTRPDDDVDWHGFVRALDPGHPVRVVLWLEEDRQDIRSPGRRFTLQKAIQKRLGWLDTRVLVQSRKSGAAPPGVTVSYVRRRRP